MTILKNLFNSLFLKRQDTRKSIFKKLLHVESPFLSQVVHRLALPYTTFNGWNNVYNLMVGIMFIIFGNCRQRHGVGSSNQLLEVEGGSRPEHVSTPWRTHGGGIQTFSESNHALKRHSQETY